MTLETLATIKNPSVVFAKQANFAAGHQQVNNGVPPSPSPSRTRKSEVERTQLLEADHGQRLDTRAPGTASGANQELEPWERSTGPKTLVGKARVARNADKGGVREMLRELSKALRDQRSELDAF